jgi:hypothetical protein
VSITALWEEVVGGVALERVVKLEASEAALQLVPPKKTREPARRHDVPGAHSPSQLHAIARIGLVRPVDVDRCVDTHAFYSVSDETRPDTNGIIGIE